MDILKAYDLFLSRDQSSKFQGYFSTDWSHLWLLYHGRNNHILVLSKRYMKHNNTPLDDQNELLAFAKRLFNNFFLEMQLRCYIAQPSPTPLDTQLGILPFPTSQNETCTIHCNSSGSSVRSAIVASSPSRYDLWTLYFKRSKTWDGSGTECVLVDPRQRKHLVLSYFEFKCTNNTTEYEALVLCLQKALSLNVVMLNMIGD